MGDFWTVDDFWIMADFWIMGDFELLVTLQMGGKHKQTDRHTHTHINTIPGLEAGPSENSSYFLSMRLRMNDKEHFKLK